MTKEERLILLARELKEIDDLFRGVQAITPMPEVLIDLMYQKAIHLAEGIEALKECNDCPAEIPVVVEPEVEFTAEVIEQQPVAPAPAKPQPVATPATPVVEEPIVEPSPVMTPVAEPEAITEIPMPDVRPDVILQETPVAPPAPAVETPIAETPVAEPTVEPAAEKKPFFEQIYRTHSQEVSVSAPQADFRRLMTLNDRFLFQRELFHGDVGMLNFTINAINDCVSLKEAEAYLKEHFQWDPESDSVVLFHDLLARHFA